VECYHFWGCHFGFYLAGCHLGCYVGGCHLGSFPRGLSCGMLTNVGLSSRNLKRGLSSVIFLVGCHLWGFHM